MNKLSTNIEDLVRSNVLTLTPYSSARSESDLNEGIFLDANENPNETGLNRYPDPLQRELKKEVSALKGINEEHIFLGNGSDEAIDILFRVFCAPRQDEILIVEPTYGMYSVSANINNINVLKASLNQDFELIASNVLEKVTPTTKIIFLCSPNNPSGNTMDSEEIRIILNNFHGIVVIDEAYIDFSSKVGWITALADYEKLVILQTFSKAWGMAGLRVGMAFASPRVIHFMNKVKPPYNLSTLVQEQVIKYIREGKEKVGSWVSQILQEREILKSQLEKLSFVYKVFESDANFLLIKVNDPNGLYNYLTEKGIVVRNRSNVALCEGCLRITVGLPAENTELLESLKIFRES